MGVIPPQRKGANMTISTQANLTFSTTADELTELEVTGFEREADGSIGILTLAPADGHPKPWSPGAHVDLLLPDGIERQYSLCGDLEGGSPWRIGVLREPTSRGGSEFVHSQLSIGDRVYARGPRNNFPLVEAPSYHFIAGGIGVTPLLPMIHEVNRNNLPWSLTYGGRSLSSLGFVGELATYGERVTFWPEDEKGLIPIAELLDSLPQDGVVYCCGPEPLLNAVEKNMEARGASERLYIERFRPRSDLSTLANIGFNVYLEDSDLEVDVGADETIVEALDREGVDVMTSCREGTCGTCETEVLEGTPDHRDSYLSPTEQASNETMMVCCSRSKTSRLVLGI